MPTIRSPRKGSMQYWPRSKAKKMYARVRSWVKGDKAKPLAFIGYKVGMTHLMAVNENKNSHLKNEEMAVPITLIECPPIRIHSIRFYKKQAQALKLEKEIFFKSEKELARKIKPAKENKELLEKINPDDYQKIMITVYTQPKKAGFGKKKPEIMEIGLGGSNKDKVEFVKNNHDKEISLDSVFEVNQVVDLHAISKGKGTQGPVKRFGIGLKPHKSEKGVRAPGALGPWSRQQHISYRVAHAGQTGFHQRFEHNKQIIDISSELEKYGKDFHKYGNIKSTYLALHGSVAGSKKRAILMTVAIRENKHKHKLSMIQ